MKLKLVLIAIPLSLLAGSLTSQNLIAVQNGGEPEFYTSLDSAIVHALDGDTIYISGGSYTLTVPIDKELHIIGVGHNPDSSISTTRTHIFGSFSLSNGSNGGSLTGIYLPNNYLYINYNINNYFISRCSVYCIYCYWPFTASNVTFIENRIDYISFNDGSQFNSFFNNIFKIISGIGNYNVVKNNIFLNNSVNLGNGTVIQNTVFENNIFISPFALPNYQYFSNNIFNNNIFLHSIEFPFLTNIGSNNITNQPQSSIFIIQTGYEFNYSHNYHIQSTSPGKNAGTDGTDIGIYGGSFPWKEGSIPFNPHFQSVVIPGTTDQNGTLNVNIKVAAQDH